MEQKIKNWILGTLSGLLVSIAGWLAIQLYNIAAKQTDMIERKLFSVQEELTRANENIIRLQEGIKAMQKENESVHAMQNMPLKPFRFYSIKMVLILLLMELLAPIQLMQ